MKIWKRNAIIASVLLLVCAGAYLNWSRAQKSDATDLTETLSAEQVMGEDTLVVNDGEGVQAAAVAASGGEQTSGAVGETACQTLNTIVGTALSEAQIESLVIAKGYDDCVTYINDGVVCVAVSAPADGLSDADAALISDIVTSQTDYSLSQVRIIEVKP